MEKRSMIPMKVITVNIVILVFLTGCATKKIEITKSGFLSSYTGLIESEDFEGMRVYKNPEVNIRDRYSKALIAPVQFKLDPSLKEHQMKDKDREMLSMYFYEQLREGLSENFVITSEPGYDVLLFRAAVTDVLPNKVYLNVHWLTSLMEGGIGGASLEAEVVDSISGERILAFVDARKGKSAIKEPKHLIKNYKEGLTKWGYTKQALGVWAENMVRTFNDLLATN